MMFIDDVYINYKPSVPNIGSFHPCTLFPTAAWPELVITQSHMVAFPTYGKAVTTKERFASNI
jgi:hypothetical protein